MFHNPFTCKKTIDHQHLIINVNNRPSTFNFVLIEDLNHLQYGFLIIFNYSILPDATNWSSSPEGIE